MQNEKKKMALAKAASNAVKSNGSKQTTKSAPAAKTPAAQKAAVKNAQDLKVKALQAKAKAAKSKFQSSKMRDENTPMPLAPGQPFARMSRAIDKKIGLSGKNIMDWEASQNKDQREYFGLDKKNKTYSEKKDSAFVTDDKILKATMSGYDPIKYKEVRKSKMPKKK